MKSLKFFSILLFLNLLSCQSTLQKAGQSHALTFQKWQALALYASKSQLTNQPSLNIVGELKIDSSGDEHKFILTNIQLSKKETAFQINLLHPQFESKFICAPQCLQLTEYLQQETGSNTMLTRYFDEQEFELFKFYGEVFSLDETIKEKKALSADYFDYYIEWLVNQQLSSVDVKSFIVQLKRIFSEEEYFSFMTNSHQIFSHLVQSNFAIGMGTEPSEVKIWKDNEKETITPETQKWRTVAETLDDFVDGINTLNLISAQAIQSVEKSEIEPGDLVCSSTSNEFGSILEIRGSTILVDVIGQRLNYSDGITVTAKPSELFDQRTITGYKLVDKVMKTYDATQISRCDLALPTS